MIFIDTGAFLARYLAADQHHAGAVRLWRKLEKSQRRPVTSNFVLDETFTLLARRASYGFAAERAKAILASRSLSVLRPGPEDELQALGFFTKFADQKVSFTDCCSFVLMKRTSVRIAFSYDRHFELAGFDSWK
ncbi:MAG: type II toxin-antitoxin system VapC family toxin [Deltaproteobacteria bacterium]|nr:type II toxin-antitoxin system VapC family toxin [Deltaproteobacteria bacterium]